MTRRKRDRLRRARNLIRRRYRCSGDVLDWLADASASEVLWTAGAFRWQAMP